MSRRHANISIFVPHIGCPHQCSFCDQRSITGAHRAPLPEDVDRAVAAAKTGKEYCPALTEIAFFGGSFTAINRGYMLDLLQAAYRYVEDGSVSGIRISTRPDAVEDEVLSLLKAYGVTSVELGAQSMNDRVLKMNNRGHSVEDIKTAANRIRQHGFSLGLQMMTGLYGDDEQTALQTAKDLIALAPETVRIYPTIVLKGTPLAALYDDKKYQPQTLQDAVSLAAKLYLLFTENGVKVIRLGLHSVEEEARIAGPWHPAFSELCQSKILLEKVLSALKEQGNYLIKVSKSDLSKMIGQKKENLIRLEEKGYHCRVEAADGLENLQFAIVKEV